jgi:hypothetical protein
MLIDSDEEEPRVKAKAPTAFVDSPKFEATAEEGPYPEVIQTLELSLGTAVLHVAVLPMTACPAEDAEMDLFREKIVFAVSCATNEVFVITLPLTPPSFESKARPELRKDLLAGKAGSGQWGETVVMLGGQTKYADGIAMALVKPKSSATSNRLKDQTSLSITPKPRVVVAAHNRQASGVLRLWDVSLDTAPGAEGRPIEPFQTEYLPNPLTSISFNPSHTTQLLAVSSPHATRVYDYAVPSMPSDELSTGPFPSQGSWQLSLHQPFARPTSTRKPILDAAWIAQGRAVLVLFADGMWGIWDVDGASPLGSTVLGKSSSGIRGAALTAFSASGYVEGISPLRTTNSQAKSRSSGGLEPMTPHTRRDAAASLASAATPERLATVNGGIVVTGLPVSGAPSGADESVVLWVGGLDHVCVIPGISRFWDMQIRKGAGGGVNLFSGAQPTRMIRLHDLNTGLLGERCCGVGAVVNFEKQKHGTSDGGLPVEILIQGESRLVIVRESDDGPGTRIGGVVSARRRLFNKNGGRAEMADAILVHPRPPSKAFDLSVNKAGSLRHPRTINGGRSGELDDGTKELSLPTRPRVGFLFGETLDAAADVGDDEATERDVEVEMLDIMEIDQALEELEEDRGNGKKKVFFEED